MPPGVRQELFRPPAAAGIGAGVSKYGVGHINPFGAEAPQSAAAKLFDLRVLIGGLFLLYGVMLTVAGFFTSSRELAKASHININLWMGLGMLVIGAFFTTWWRLRPLQRPEPQPDEPQPDIGASH